MLNLFFTKNIFGLFFYSCYRTGNIIVETDNVEEIAYLLCEKKYDTSRVVKIRIRKTHTDQNKICCPGDLRFLSQIPESEEMEANKYPPIPYFRLYKYATALHKLFIFTALIFVAIGAVCTSLFFIIFGDVTGVVVRYSTTTKSNITQNELNEAKEQLQSGLIDFVTYSCGIAIVILITIYISTLVFNHTALKQTYRIRELFLTAVLNQDISWYDLNRTGDFASRIVDDLVKVEEGIGEKVSVFVFHNIVFLTCAIQALIKGWKLALICMVWFPAAAITMGFVSWIASKLSTKEIEAYGEAGALAEETLSSIRTVVAFGGEAKEQKRYDKLLVSAKNNNIKRSFFTGTSNALMWFFIFASYSFSFWYGVDLILSDRVLPPEDITYDTAKMVTVYFSALSATQNFGLAAQFFETFGVAKGAAAKIFAVIESKPTINASKGKGVKPARMDGIITFENVYFNYPARPDVKVLQGLSLTVNAGETVALVGSSGCGKSTCVQLIQRYYEPDSGSLSIDGNKLTDLDLTWLRSHIGVVGQEPTLFEMTIAENISLGCTTATTEDIEIAAKKANAHSFISLLPLGYNTLVGERGTQLSGGQKQRIAIARALVRKPALLLLDEATSALDTNSEAVVQAALDAASNECTTIIVAHRLSTVRRANRIVVIAEGKVQEQGSHDELMAAQGAYYRLVHAQVSPDSTEDEAKGPAIFKSDAKNSAILTQQTSEDIKKVNTPAVGAKKSAKLTQSTSADTKKINTPAVDSKESAKLKQQTGASSKKVNTPAVDAKKGAKLAQQTNADSVNRTNVEYLPSSQTMSTPEPEIMKPHFSSLWEIMKINVSEWWIIIIGCVASVVNGVGMPIYAIVFGNVLGVLSSPDSDFVRSETNKYCLFFLVVGSVIGIATLIQSFMFGIAGERLTMRLRSRMFKALLVQEMAWFDNKDHGTGSLCSQLSGEAAVVQGATGQRISVILNTITLVVVSLGTSFYYEWRIALLGSCFFPLIAVTIYMEKKSLQAASEGSHSSLQKSTKIAVEAINGIRTVVSLGCESTFHDLYVAELIPQLKVAKKNSHIRGLVYGFSRSLVYLIYPAAFYYGGKLVENEGLNYGYMFIVVTSLINSSWSMGNSLALTPDFEKGLIAATRIFELLHRIPKIQNGYGSSNEKWAKSNIEFQKVHFSYPTRPISILNGLNLSVLQGKMVALVGPSGCGKSTIVQLLERFYDPTDGSVQADGKNIKSMHLSALRSHLGIVSQEPVLFSTTIAENIAYGDNSRVVNREEIIQAATMANIHSFIASLPLGYDTKLGEKGTQLSGGQKQRIAIARALVRNPKVLLLDEATSALDAESEKVVQHALDNAKMGRTCITIAHRLTTIQDADVICVISQGKVAEMGTHSELVTLKGLYYNLQSLQSGMH